MDFTFKDDHVDFSDSIRKFLMVEAAPEMLREIWETESGRSKALREKLAEQGLTALSVPEEFNGIGLGDLDWILIHQELGYYAIPDSLSDTAYLAAWLLNNLPADAALKKEWLPKIANGSVRIAIGHPVNPMVADAANADLLLMWHNDEIHAVQRKQVQMTARASIDASRRLCEVKWKPSDATRVCPASHGAALWQGLLDRAALAAAAHLLGLAQRMLDLGIDYSAQRKQFGKPIGSFQAVKHQLADVAVKIEFAKPVLYRAAYSVMHDKSRRSVNVSHAKLACGEAAWVSARKSIQVHGAMGYTWEADLQMFMKRAWSLNAAWGDQTFHKKRIADFIYADGAPLGPGETFTN